MVSVGRPAPNRTLWTGAAFQVSSHAGPKRGPTCRRWHVEVARQRFQLQIQSGRLHLLDRSMVVAVVAVRMVEMTVDEIVDVIAVRHRFMAASRTVNMARLMAAAVSGTHIGIGRAYFEPVFVHMITVRVMQVAVVQIVDVIVMHDRRVAACRSVPMIVMGMMWFVTGAHGDFPRGLSGGLFAGRGRMGEQAIEQRAHIQGEYTRLVADSPAMLHALPSGTRTAASRIVRLNQSRQATFTLREQDQQPQAYHMCVRYYTPVSRRRAETTIGANAWNPFTPSCSIIAQSIDRWK